jgi:hypothetical protein
LREDAESAGERPLAEAQGAQRVVGFGEKAVEGVDGVSTLILSVRAERAIHSRILFEPLVNGLPVVRLLASGVRHLSVLLPRDGVPLRGLGDASSAPPQTEQASPRS